MKNVRFVFVLLITIVLGLFLTVPVGDIPETAFDESETPAYEATPLFSIEVPQAAALETPDEQSAADLRSGAQSLFTSAHSSGKNATRSPNVRGALALLCSLRC